ncbi:MAG: cation transporter [Chloroflexi bacterium]|jgi:cation diffusion facilitator family transporter|nr:cation transporter [Chloroflexota bacterium]MDB5074046.1 cation transporter [Chloroflexota bacterium]
MAEQKTIPSSAHAKQSAALASVGAGLALTTLKVVIGLLSGSLGILAEAAHSGLDLVAALMTLLAVRLADRPADASHPYGHGKIENLSAFLEAFLLLLTAAWVGYEAVIRLASHNVHVDASGWAFAVMIVSIGIDVRRSRALRRAAREYHSQALAADALHFSTDIWSSAVVLAGLVAIRIGDWTGWPGPWEQADAIAALGVCGVVVFVGGRMIKETVDALLDRAPETLVGQIEAAARSVPGVVTCNPPRLRRVGNKLFADLVLQIPRTASFNGAHATTEAVEQAVKAAIPETDMDLVLHMEPISAPDERPDDTIRFLAREAGLRVHDVRVTHEVSGGLEADLHVEVDPALSLAGSHAQVDWLEQTARAAVPNLRTLNTHLEVLAPPVERRVEVTSEQQSLVKQVSAIADGLLEPGACHEVRVYRPLPTKEHADSQEPTYDLVLHVSFPGAMSITMVHERSEEIERALRADLPNLAHVLIHAEPRELDQQ